MKKRKLLLFSMRKDDFDLFFHINMALAAFESVIDDVIRSLKHRPGS